MQNTLYHQSYGIATVSYFHNVFYHAIQKLLYGSGW